ncbi:MAG: 3-hydroxyacyl-CoA dehydrogenase family protein [Deltaproteobacteria bacterium]|nr:3-hydroxyacyl-CoA dehydrogenase family protein [Myxococcales bacterium]MDP3219457.1 3-hydroxyacyl-CoA dehydrogenase family protein [Deltaproteobacteria bacterium]
MSESTKVAVLGAGTMGHGIAQVCAAAGFTVHVSDPSEAARARGLEGVRASLDRMVGKAKMTAAQRDEVLGRIAWGGDLGAAVEDAGVVIEAVPERIELKRDLLQRVDALAPDSALLGSNTSSLSITELGSTLRDASRLVGLHFFNPVPVMELLEVVRGVRTSEATIDRALAFAARLPKTPIVVRDMPGFATSRLGVALGAEAIRMLEQGVASAEDIDRAMELGYRHPMGPLRLTDLVGLDVRLAILDHLHREVGEQFRAPPLLRQMVRAGKLGKKSGEGFYKW